MIRNFLLITLLAAFPAMPYSQDRSALVLAEYTIDENTNTLSATLVRYNFVSGSYASKDTIIADLMALRPGMLAPFERENAFIHLNRYVVGKNGLVIDLITHEVLFNKNATYISCSETEICFSDMVDGKSGRHSLNLSNRTITFVETQSFSPGWIISPDGKSALELYAHQVPFKIVLHRQNASPDTIVKDARYGRELAYHGGPFVPMFWISNNNFVYATDFVSSFSQLGLFSTVDVYEMNTSSGDKTHLLKVDTVPSTTSKAEFFYDSSKRLIFECETGQYRLTPGSPSSEKVMPGYDTHSFYFADNKAIDETIIMYGEKKIDRCWCADLVTNPGVAAVSFGTENSNMYYPEGVRAWNAITGEWTEFKIPGMSRLIGWVTYD